MTDVDLPPCAECSAPAPYRFPTLVWVRQDDGCARLEALSPYTSLCAEHGLELLRGGMRAAVARREEM